MFIADDALISLRYAERLATGHGLTWNDGESVEGYSNLAWVLVLAGWGAAGGDLINGSRFVGFAGAVELPLVALVLGGVAFVANAALGPDVRPSPSSRPGRPRPRPRTPPCGERHRRVGRVELHEAVGPPGWS